MTIRLEEPKINGALYDALLELKDAGAIVESAAAQVASAAKVLTIGNGKVKGEVIADITAFDITSNDEVYLIVCQFSSVANFASDIVNGAILEVGATEVNSGGAKDSTIGRYTIPFRNDIKGVNYPYMRLYTKVVGTTPSINYSAFATINA